MVQSTSLLGQKNTLQKLDLQYIMSGEKFIGYSPESIFWHPNSKEIFFSWNPTNDSLRSTYRVSVPFSEVPMKWPSDKRFPFTPGGGKQTKRHTRDQAEDSKNIYKYY